MFRVCMMLDVRTAAGKVAYVLNSVPLSPVKPGELHDLVSQAEVTKPVCITRDSYKPGGMGSNNHQLSI